MENILSLKYLASIPSVYIIMESPNKRRIIVDHGEKILDLKSLVMGYFIMQLVQIFPIDLRTKLRTT